MSAPGEWRHLVRNERGLHIMYDVVTHACSGRLVEQQQQQQHALLTK